VTRRKVEGKEGEEEKERLVNVMIKASSAVLNRDEDCLNPPDV
jgi:hypothetical protein